jgi:cell wall-associated NlpC family hydrolase
MPTHVVAIAAIAPVLAGPSVRQEQVNQLALGETAEVLGSEGDYRRVRVDRDGYEGWVNRGYLRGLERADAFGWRDAATAWSMGAVIDLDGHCIPLPLRARVATDSVAVTLPDGRVGVVKSGCVMGADRLAEEARTKSAECWALAQFEGVPYQWGGVTSWGVDCSGLVQTTYAARGVDLPRDSAQQATVGDAVPLDALRPGDLLFFRSESGADHITHVAFYGDGDTLVHSTISCGGVLREPFSAGSRAAALRTRLVAARRYEAR